MRTLRELSVDGGKVRIRTPLGEMCQWKDYKAMATEAGMIACKSYLKKFGEADFSGRIPFISVSYVQPKQECTSRELFRKILEEYGDELPRGTVGDARSKTLKVLQACKTEMLIIDEADRLKPKTFADVRDIFDSLEIAVILVGTTKRLDPAVKKDEQVFNRFRSSYRIGTIPSKQLKELVGVWERDIIKLPVPSNLSSEPILKVLRKATGLAKRGYYIGLIDMVLRGAAIRALENGQMKISLEVLQEVAEEYS